MRVVPIRSEAASRGARMLRTALGPAIALWLDDPAVIEVMLNPDGKLWIDRLGEGVSDTGDTMAAVDGERIIRLVAHHVGVEVHSGAPRVSAELPESGERFEGLIPPVVAAPSFAIRKPAVAVFTLSDYVAAGIMSADQANVLRSAVATRQNILVAGGTSTGKTTLTNALLAEVAKTGDRVVLIEDTRELQCTAPNLVALRTKDGVRSCPLRAALAPGPHSDWRSPGRRSPRFIESLGNRTSRWRRHDPCRVSHRHAAADGATHSRGGRHRPARADRRDHQHHRRAGA
jgi:type IV secretion system protein TrbB